MLVRKCGLIEGFCACKDTRLQDDMKTVAVSQKEWAQAEVKVIVRVSEYLIKSENMRRFAQWATVEFKTK